MWEEAEIIAVPDRVQKYESHRSSFGLFPALAFIFVIYKILIKKLPGTDLSSLLQVTSLLLQNPW